MTDTDYDFIIVGGGLAGQASALLLSKFNNRIALFEKKEFPAHKVCGEYVSNDVLDILSECGFDPYAWGASSITKVKLVSPSGKSTLFNHENGGFGLSRYTMDFQLAELCKRKVDTFFNCRVINISFQNDHFVVQTSDGQTYTARFVIGSYGKRDTLDKSLNRDFLNEHTGYLGVKYHVRTDYPTNEIGLYYFKGGYCGIVKIEKDLYNLCYLFHKTGKDVIENLDTVETKYLFRNESLASLFRNSEIVGGSTSTIHQVYFGKKEQTQQHVLFCGDTAGMITPLCGNGMSMALQGAKILAEVIRKYWTKQEGRNISRELLEREYSERWQMAFNRRLFWGRSLQGLSEIPIITESTLGILRSIPSLARMIISKTHGKLNPGHLPESM
jgi:flavin-dependent dehydrogenase